MKKRLAPRISIILTFLTIIRCPAQNPIPAAYSGTWVNWTRTWVPTAPEQNPANLLIRPLIDVKQTTAYSDGFGRPLQNVAKQASPLGNDMVIPSIYDTTTGNEYLKYLPFTSNAATGGDVTNDGNFKVDRFQEQVAFYNTYLNGQQGETNVGTGGSNWAYSQMNYEASPLNRLQNNYAAGVSWVGSQSSQTKHNTQQEFMMNMTNDQVQIWTIPGWSLSNPEQNIIPANAGTYAAGTLYKTISTDEQGNQTETFKDLNGQTILKKVQLQPSSPLYSPFDNGSGSGYSGWISTYYVYDDHGNLRFIITPNVVNQMATANSWTISQSQADELCYRFEYDQLNHLIIKKTPGTPTGSLGEVWMVYDQRNRLVMLQDGNLRNNLKQWNYIQYDNLNRPIAGGLITDPTNYNNLSYHVTNAATSGNTSTGVSAWPTLSSYTVEIVNQTIYDGYSNIASTLSQTMDASTNGSGNPAFTTTYNTAPNYAQPILQSAMTQGLPTGANAEVLGTNDQQYISSATFYDGKGRVIQTEVYNYSKGKDLSTNQYSWSGEVLNTLAYQNYVSSSNPQTHWLASAMTYDVMGRLLTVTKTINSTINGVALTAPSTNPTTVLTCKYDETNRLMNKELGNNLENLAYGYNIRGWLLGINQGYISGSSSAYFGLELGYDKTNSMAPGNAYITPAFTGNIEGTVWKTKGDGVNRKYDMTYDCTNRFTGAAYNEYSGGTWNNSYMDFSVSGGASGLAIPYDANGNIQALWQNGFVQGGKQPIDELTYNYINGTGNSNRLQYVNDGVNVTNSTLGDFHFPGSPKNSSSVDYAYDDDANTISDNNRSITGISYYGALNLPNTISVSNSAVTGNIQYFYDGLGNKLEKLATQTNVTIKGVTTNIVTTTKYVGGFVYKSLNYSNSAFASLNYTDVLQFVASEEGRLRFKPAVGSVVASFVHDYFIRDHLGNVRVGITDEVPQYTYPAATGETTQVTVNGTTNDAQNYEAQYYSFNANDFISSSSLPAWYSSMPGSNYQNQNNSGNPANNDPYSQVTAASAKVLQLCGNTANNATGDNFGCGIALKVMAGDVINIYALSFWHNSGNLPPGSYPVSSVISSLLGAFGSSLAVTSTISHSVLDGSAFNSSSTGPTATLLSPMLPTSSSQSGTQAPYAGVNYIIFDDQFRPQGSTVGFDPVSTTSDAIKNHNLSVTIPKNGYIYVYVSNQSNLNVYFDNLQVVQTQGPMLEETHYYPVGLAMAGISDRAWNREPNYFHFQGKEMQNEEWYNGSGLEEYDFSARFYDPQLGRWNTQDPAGQFASPYTGMGNNWPKITDPTGEWGVDNLIVAAVSFAVGFVEYGISDHWVHIGKAFEEGGISAGEAELAYIALGGGGYVDYGKPGFLGGASFAADGATSGIASNAWPFAWSYAAVSAFTYAQNYQQIESATPSGQLGLLAGYNATSAITAGFNSNNMQQFVDGWFPPQSWLHAGWLTSGALSQGFGGAISNAGNELLVNGGGWTPSTGFSAVSGFLANYGGQMAHNASGKLFSPSFTKSAQGASWFNNYWKKALASAVENSASGFTQQLIGNWENQFGAKNGYVDPSQSPNWWQYIGGSPYWWGGYVNGLGGYQSDIYQLYNPN